MKYDFENGKYTVVCDREEFRALRYGEPWRDLIGDNLVHAMFAEVVELRAALNRLVDEARDVAYDEEGFVLNPDLADAVDAADAMLRAREANNG